MSGRPAGALTLVAHAAVAADPAIERARADLERSLSAVQRRVLELALVEAFLVGYGARQAEELHRLRERDRALVESPAARIDPVAFLRPEVGTVPRRARQPWPWGLLRVLRGVREVLRVIGFRRRA